MKFKEIKKIGKEAREKKLKDLRIELIKSKTAISKQSGSKTKNIKKIIARIMTLNNQEKTGVEKKE